MSYKLQRPEFHDYWQDDYIDTLGVESFTKKDLEKCRGLHNFEYINRLVNKFLLQDYHPYLRKSNQKLWKNLPPS